MEKALLERLPELQEFHNIFFGEKNRNTHPQKHGLFDSYKEMLQQAGFVGIIIYKNWQCTFDDEYTYYFGRPLLSSEREQKKIDTIITGLQEVKKEGALFSYEIIYF